MEIRELIKKAIEAKENAYVPYSKFRVGAALLAKNGSVYTGCNIESASYTPTNCAERTAYFKAVSEGVREFDMIVITSDVDGYTYPCGVCRQVMREFSNELRIIIANTIDDYKEYTLDEIFPFGFGPEDLNANKKEL